MHFAIYCWMKKAALERGPGPRFLPALACGSHSLQRAREARKWQGGARRVACAEDAFFVNACTS